MKHAARESKSVVSIGSLAEELRESQRRRKGRILEGRVDGGHQENTTH